MPKLVGGLAALVALAAGILAHVDPMATLWRATLAFFLGWAGTQVWYVFFTVQNERDSAEGVVPGIDGDKAA